MKKVNNLSAKGNRINVAIADRCQRRYRKPEGVRDGAERLRLGIMLENVDAHSRAEHHEHGKKKHHHQFPPNQFKGPLQRFHIGDEAQQFGNAQNPQGPQGLTAGKAEEQTCPEGRNRNQVDQSPEAEDIA